MPSGEAEISLKRSFGVHWATFQLGDEEPIQPAKDLAKALLDAARTDFTTLPIGGVIRVAGD